MKEDKEIIETMKKKVSGKIIKKSKDAMMIAALKKKC